jgi:hypothetical protein
MESVLIKLLRDLWSESYRNYPALKDFLSRGYAAPRGFQVPETEWPSLQRDILFLGLNPSYPDSHEGNAERSFPSNGISTDFPELIFDVSEGAASSEFTPHYPDLNELIQKAVLPGHSYAYLNLFFCRMDAHAPVSAIMDLPGGLDFLCGQLSITDWYIRHIVRPRMIVVLNEEACDYLGLNAEWHDVPPRNVWMGYRRSAEFERVMGMYSVSAIQSALNEESEMEPLASPIYVLPASNYADHSPHTTALLAWHISRGCRLLSCAPKGVPASASYMELLELLEVRLAEIRRNKATALDQGNYEWVAKDRDMERNLFNRVTALVDDLK